MGSASSKPPRPLNANCVYDLINGYKYYADINGALGLSTCEYTPNSASTGVYILVVLLLVAIILSVAAIFYKYGRAVAICDIWRKPSYDLPWYLEDMYCREILRQDPDNMGGRRFRCVRHWKNNDGVGRTVTIIENLGRVPAGDEEFKRGAAESDSNGLRTSGIELEEGRGNRGVSTMPSNTLGTSNTNPIITFSSNTDGNSAENSPLAPARNPFISLYDSVRPSEERIEYTSTGTAEAAIASAPETTTDDDDNEGRERRDILRSDIAPPPYVKHQWRSYV